MRKIYLPVFLCCIVILANAQTNIPANAIVTQNFNSIGATSTATLPANWKMSSAGTGVTSNWATGTNITATTQAASSGTPAAGGAYNWATTSATDRAIGFMTNGYSSPNSIMAFYRNATGATVTTVTVMFAIERYRVNTSSFSLAFFSSSDGAAWTARTAGDITAAVFSTGASTYTFASPQTIYKTVTITGLNILNNGDIYLRWIFTNTGSTNSQGLALDDVSVFAGTATPAMTASLRDALVIDNPPINQANPGDQLGYTTIIKNTGTGDANTVTLTAPAPANTTLVGGSIKTSALARDESYATPLNTALTGNNVLTNDYGLPSLTVTTFGPVKNAAATSAGGTGTSDNGGTVIVNANGTFIYTPPAGFVGVDKFAYIATTGNAPDNDAIVTISVGGAASANNDAYSVVGNVSIVPNAAAGVLNNDLGNGVVITAVNGNAANVGAAILTANNGNLTLNANGSFTYNPPAGFEGNDNFTYTIDNGFSSPQTATVTLTISGMCWFITNGGAAGDGRLSSPFNSIAAFQAVNNGTGNNPGANDNIFVYENAAPYTGSLTLLNGQRLIGQDATATLNAITGLTPNATYSNQFPVMNTGAPTTLLTTTVAATHAVNLGSGNTLRGFTLGNTTGSGISGTGFGTLLISEVSKNGTGQALALTTGAFGSPATIDNITSTSSVNAVSLTGCTGILTISTGAISGATGTAFSISGGTTSVTYSGAITQANNAAMINVSGGHATGTITFNTGTLSATNGTGLQFDNADGIYNFNGTTTLNGGDAGIDILNGSGGTFTFVSATSITNPSGIGFNIGGTANTCAVTYNGSITKNSVNATVNIANHATGTVTFQTGTITATNGTGLQFDNADAVYNFNGVVTLNGGDAGIDIINGSNGNFSFVNAPITNPTGVAFLVNAGAGSIGHTGVISKTSAGRLIDIQSRTGGSVTINSNLSSTTSSSGINVSSCNGGTITFAGSTKTLNTPGNNPVNFVTNTGATINFTNGGLAITSTTANGFNATGGGTISVQGAVNTIASTTGTALNVANTTIGAANLNFQSISANGAVNGIVINTSGILGGLIVTGDGTTTAGGNSSGGTIQNTTSHGISLTSTQSPSLNNITINNTSGSGIEGSAVTNFTLQYSSISNSATGGGADESNIAFDVQGAGTETNVSGVVSITNNILTNSRWHGIRILNFNGTIADLIITNNTITSSTAIASSLGSGIHIQSLGSASTTSQITKANISNNTIANFPSDAGIEVKGGNSTATGPGGTMGTPGNPTNIINITGNSIRGQSAANRMGTTFIDIGVSGGNSASRSQANFNISNNGTLANPMSHCSGIGIGVGNTGYATSSIVINNNFITANNTVGSAGIGGGNGLVLSSSETPDLTWTITNNNITQTDGNGILAVARAVNGLLKVSVKSNTVAAPLAGVRPGIRVDAGNNTAGEDAAVCLDISSNTSAGSGGTQGIGLRKQGTNSTINDFGIEGMAATATPGIEAYVNGLNPAGGGTLLISATSGFSNCNTAPRMIVVKN